MSHALLKAGALCGTASSGLPAFTPILDSVSTPWAAYSLRKIRTAYAGNWIQVKRASDRATQNIGNAADKYVDRDAIASFCSGTTGRISIWYDQSGNGRNTTPSSSVSTSPIIYESGSVTLDANDRPYAYHPDAERTCCAVINASFASNNNLSAFFALNFSFPSGGDWRFGGSYVTGIFGITLSGGTYYPFFYRGGYHSTSGGVTAGSRYVMSYFRNAADTYIAINGAASENVDTGFTDFAVDMQGVGAAAKGTYPATTVDTLQEFCGKMYELILYASYNTTDKSAIETSLAEY